VLLPWAPADCLDDEAEGVWQEGVFMGKRGLEDSLGGRGSPSTMLL